MLTAPTLSKLILLLALGVVIFVSRAHFETSLRGGAVAEKMKETPLLDRGLVGGDVEGMTPTLPPPSPWDTVGEPYYGLGEHTTRRQRSGTTNPMKNAGTTVSYGTTSTRPLTP